MILHIESLVEVSASIALLALAVLLITISFQVTPFFKKLIEATDESIKMMKTYQKLGEESTTAVQHSQDILSAGKEISNDVIEAKRSVVSTGSAICSNLLEVVLETFNK